MSWEDASPTVIGEARASKGASVADPRPCAYTHAVDLSGAAPRILGPRMDGSARGGCTAVIRAADGTWHRPLTTLELAALQGFPTRAADGAWLRLPGGSHAVWRELIGNAIPPGAAEAIAKSCMDTLEAAGVGFQLRGEPVWVAPQEAA